MKELDKIMSVLEYKINYYEKAIQYGTEEIHKKKI